MSSRRRRKTSRTRRLDGTDAQQRLAAEASLAFWHGRPAVNTATHSGSGDPSADNTAGTTDRVTAGTSNGSAVEAPAQQSLIDRTARVKVTSDPTSTVRSLGKPPLSGREVVAEHYFEAVYQRAVAMAGALAAAGGLLADDDGML